MSTTDLHLRADPSVTSLHSGSSRLGMSGGIRPSTIMPRPGTAGHSLIPEPPVEARDLSVMGTSALASLELSGNSATASEVLADPAVLQWFEDNQDVPKGIIDMINSVHQKKMEALKAVAIQNVSAIKDLADDKVTQSAKVASLNTVLQQQVNEFQARSVKAAIPCGSSESEPERLARRGNDLFAKQVEALTIYAKNAEKLSSDLQRIDQQIDSVQEQAVFSSNEIALEERLLNQKKHKISVDARLLKEFRKIR